MQTEKENITEINTKKKNNSTLSAIIQRINGDIIPDKFVKKNLGIIVLMFFLVILYVHFGYLYQKKLLRLVHLKEELLDLKYQALSIQSEVMEKSLRSQVEEYSKHRSNNLEIKTTPRYIIK